MIQKLINLLFFSLVVFCCWAIYHSQPNFSNPISIENEENKEEAFSGAGKSLDAWSLARSYPSENIQPAKISEAHQVKNRLKPEAENRSNWQPMGPQNFAGRILTIAVDPNNPNTLFAGAASGGLWKSIDDGQHWNYVSTGMPVLGVSSIAINPNNSDEIIIGTGEVYGDFDTTDNLPNQNTGQGYTIRYRRGTYGIGILKTTDGGLTWDYSLDWSQESELKGVNVLKMSPSNPDSIYAGTTDGLFLSTNGGNSWSNILALPNVMSISISENGVFLIGVGTFDSSGRGVYRSEDGVNFSLVDLPVFSGKAMLEFSAANPNIAFASLGNYDETVGLFRSEDAGISWEMSNDYDYARYQGWYSHDVATNPNNESTVLVGGINVYRSINNGETLIPESDWLLWNLSAFPIEGPEQPAGDFIHADIHDIIYHPTIPNKIYVASDGGIFISYNDGLDFTSANTGLQTAQFYQSFSSSMTDEDFAMGGLQDNATAIYRGSLAWERVIGGDGFGTIIDPNDDRHVWGSLYYMRLFFSNNKGNSFNSNTGVLPGCSGVDPDCFCNFSAPISFAPSSLNRRIYGASNIVYTIENGTTRTATNGGIPLDGNNPVNCLATSPNDENLVFAGTAPLYSSPAKMFKTENGGDTWMEVTNGLPDRFPMDVKIDPCDNDKIYVAFGGYDMDFHLYKSEDGGDSWQGLGEDLPDVPTNTILVDPENTNHIYVGNDIGVFVSTDAGITWSSYSTGLPDACMIMSLSYTPVNRKLRIATHGNGAYETEFLQDQENFVAKASGLGEWYANDFEVVFEEEPNACVFQQCFYNIRDFDGTDWRSNNSRGFVFEDFDQTTLNEEWSALQGFWQIDNEVLQQTNSNHQNTQLNINLTQTDASVFMYHWKMNIEGNGVEKRAGVHIFADDLTQDFRGNSYLINFFENNNQVKIYKTNSSGEYQILLTENIYIPSEEWLDCKVVYEPPIGRISVFLNDTKVAYVIDENPLLSGNGFSLRSGNAHVSYDDITIYKGRDCSGEKTIEVGINGDCRFETEDDATFVCGVESIGFSILRGWSEADESSVKIGEHTLSLQGSIFTEDVESVGNVDVNLSISDFGSSSTDNLGQYDFDVMSGSSFDIIPEKLDDPKNGVNTFDLVLIRLHILNLEEFTSPYELIAADVDNNGNVTTIDIVRIRQLILDFVETFPNNNSWRFAPSDYVFPDDFDLEEFPEKIQINQIAEDRIDANFVGIKTGDVNSSANLFAPNQQADLRTDQFVKFLLQKKKLNAGAAIEIPFLVKDFKEITGYQMTFEFDESIVEFLEFIPNQLVDLPKEFVGTSKKSEGKLLINWVSGEAISLENNTELFKMKFKVKRNANFADLFKITDTELLSEAYNKEKTFLKLTLDFEEQPRNIFSEVLFSPNPFKDFTNLGFRSEMDGEAAITFYSELGKTIVSRKLEYRKGINSISFDFLNHQHSVLIFYKIECDQGNWSGRVMKL